MYKTIAYPQTECLAKGRNGFAYSGGIHLSNHQNELMLETVGSRGDIGAARLVIPLSHIPELQAALTAFVAECEAANAAVLGLPPQGSQTQEAAECEAANAAGERD